MGVEEFLVKTDTDLDAVKARFKHAVKNQFPLGPANVDQFCDIVRTWLTGWSECLWHLNHTYPPSRNITREIQFFHLHLSPVFKADWYPDESWKWW